MKEVALVHQVLTPTNRPINFGFKKLHEDFHAAFFMPDTLKSNALFTPCFLKIRYHPDHEQPI